MKQDVRRRVLVALAVTCVMGTLSAGDVMAEDTVITRSYGPAITLTGKESDLDRYVHSDWNKTITYEKGTNVVGTFVAYGKGNTVTYDNKEGTFGKSTGDDTPSFPIVIDTSQLKGKFYKDPISWGIDGSKMEGKSLTVKDAVVAKSEMGGTLIFTGKDMNFNLLYAHKNQYLEEKAKEEYMPSTIEINLTGDLTYDNPTGKAVDGDWLYQASGRAGYEYPIGDIITNHDGSDGGEQGIIRVRANNINVRDVYAHEDSEIALLAKGTLTTKDVKNVEDSTFIATGKAITIPSLSAFGDGTTTTIGTKEDTDTVSIGGMTIRGKGNTAIYGKTIGIGNLAINSKANTLNDMGTIHIEGNDVTLAGDLFAKGSNVSILADTLHAKTGTVRLSQNSMLSIKANTLDMSIKEVLYELEGDEVKGEKPSTPNASLSIEGNSKTFTMGPIRIISGWSAIDVKGMDTLNAGYISINGETTINNKYSSDVNYEAKDIHLSAPSHTMGNEINKIPSNQSIATSEGDTVTLLAKNSITLDGGIKGKGEVTLKAPTIKAYRIGAGTPTEFGFTDSGATTNVMTDSLEVTTAMSAMYPGSTLNVTTKSLIFTENGAYDTTSMGDPFSSLRDEGTIWTSRGGIINLTIDGGESSFSTLVSKEVVSDDKLIALKKAYGSFFPWVNEGVDKTVPVHTSTLNVNLTNGADWHVTKDSSVTHLHNDGFITLGKTDTDNTLSNLTVDNLTGDGMILFKKVGDTVSTLTAKKASGILSASLIDVTTGGNLDTVYPKTLLATIEDKSNLTLKPTYIFTEGALLGYKVPIKEDEHTIYLEGAFEKSKDAITSKVSGMRKASHMMNQSLFYLTERPLYNEDAPLEKDAWVSASRGNVSYLGLSGKDMKLSLGVPLVNDDSKVIGVSYNKNALSFTGNIDVKAHEFGVYGATKLSHGYYVAGDMYLGRMHQSFFTESHERTLYGAHVELGKTISHNKGDITPVLGFSYGHVGAYDMHIAPFKGKVSPASYLSMKLGLRGTYQVTDALSLKGQLFFHKSLKHAGDITLSDKVDSVTLPLSDLHTGMTFGLGANYKVKDTTISLMLSKTRMGDVKGKWGATLRGTLSF